ncbi:MAG: alpha-ketoglutarate-dependent dioxygenase AlkB family protein [Shewanella sp.]
MTKPAICPISLFPRYISQELSQQLQDESRTYPLTQPQIRLFGKSIAIPRQQAWFADSGCDYKYSSLMITAKPWPSLLAQLRQRLITDFGTPVNGVLVNHYRHGAESMGWHSDNEAEIVDNSDIYSISLGATRDFLLRHSNGEKVTIPLHDGDLLIMHYPMQQEWQHSLPKRARVQTSRWNFTFRQLTPYFHES